jgi:hypothetical protein
MKGYEMKNYHSTDTVSRVNMSQSVTGEELLDALFQLKVVARYRIPPLGFKKGQAVGPRDKAAQLIILRWLVEKYPDSLLPSLMMEKDPTATCRVFNEFLDGRRNFDSTREEFCMQARELGHEATLVEVLSTMQLLDEALFVLNSSLLAAESPTNMSS